MRTMTAAMVAIAALLVGMPAAHAAPSKLDRARSQANAAAAALAGAETRLSIVESQLASLESRLEATQRRLTSLQSAVREVAVVGFMRGNRVSDNLDIDPADASAKVRAAALAQFVAAGSSDAIDAYRAAGQDLAAAEARLTATRSSASAALATYRQRASAVAAQLHQLESLEAERIAAEKEQRANAARQPRRPSSVIIGTGDWICPVQGPRAFSDDYGQPRPGGRRHEGNDILSPRGTPVVAPVAGAASQHDNGRGGHAFYLHGVDGVTYYGAHLDAYTSNYGQVAPGTVLGYVGNTGDASGGPTHLHFEVHPGGGGPVDPYPTLRTYC